MVLHSCKVTSPAELYLDNMALNAGDVGYPALPLETAYGAQVTLLELFEEFYMSTISCPGFTSIEKDGKDRCPEHVNVGA